MRPLKKARKRLDARRKGWQATLEDLSRRSSIDVAKAFKMPGSMKRK